jgi:hypothetical protein
VNKPSKRATPAFATMPHGYSHRQVGERIFGSCNVSTLSATLASKFAIEPE